MDLIQLLYDVSDEVCVCTKCRLAETRTYAVPGEGDPQAQIMFVGEGPGEQEDLSGRPFVGKSGQLLTRELERIGITRDLVFITNIVKCRPPKNRVPLVDEIEACNDWLMAQIALINPKFIVPVGGPSLQTLVSKDLRIMRSRSKVFRKEGILFIPILHPSAALRSPDTMKSFLDDLKNLRAYLDREIEESEITDITPRPVYTSPSPKVTETAEVKEEGGTLSLF